MSVALLGTLATLLAARLSGLPFGLCIFSAALRILARALLGRLVGAFVGRARWLVALAIPLLLVTAPVAMIPADFGQRFDARIPTHR